MGRQEIPQLIKDTTMQLLNTTEVTRLTTSQIVKACSIHPRTFYNHFSSKYEVANAIYKSHMEQYINCSVNEWYAQKLMYFMSEPMFFKHTLCYFGQNCLAEAIISLEQEKLSMHIKEEILQDQDELLRTKIAIEYIACGNLGALMHTVVSLEGSPYGQAPSEQYKKVWNDIISGAPPAMLDNLHLSYELERTEALNIR